jgi:hypothetical protein
MLKYLVDKESKDDTNVEKLLDDEFIFAFLLMIDWISGCSLFKKVAFIFFRRRFPLWTVGILTIHFSKNSKMEAATRSLGMEDTGGHQE